MTQALTESRNPRTIYIDRLNTRDAVKLFINEDKAVLTAVEACGESIALAVEYTVQAFLAGGRLVYIGAGTSGRLGVLDASECPPTFGVSPDMVVGLIAGGEKALRTAVEGAEDNAARGREDLEDIGFCKDDILVGITASGSTPYVKGALNYARSVEAKTVLLTCNPYGELPEADVLINPVVGPEIICGSTRLKSGTACKMVLNMISSVSMIKIGKVFENLMVDVRATNSKLKKRALRIVMDGGRVPNYLAEAKLEEANGDVKLAILLARTDLDAEQGRKKLKSVGGVLYKALGEIDYE
ncbi:MAG: N-acetylmuramic acid 6-phosphate etherase [bacterium ADurb.Bin157]|jgi:N-acetylmuramic acid 6-phosphate etherase|nr:N-acetylmuramic acid 6-phosphate etherase [Candidatus Riflebacteria bacterium]OQB48888.1 MAG: N-acetylmuramic acid 6-phosphate etherase [bacterium ADurb.Bin157]